MKELLIEQLFKKYNFTQQQGLMLTSIEKVNLIKIDHCSQSREILYNRGIFLIASGENVGFLNSSEVILGNKHFVIVATAQPAECETLLCTKPMKGVYIDLDLQRLQRINAILDSEMEVDTTKTPKNVVTANMTDEIDSVFERLMKTLLNDEESKILGDQIIDELYYRIIKTPMGSHLMQLSTQLTHFSRISNVIDEIQNSLDDEINIDDLAAKVDMQRANFHKKFKEIYNDSPIQYIKKIRLNKARHYIEFEKMKVIDAASKVGYESPNQFSREFKRHFGVSPSEVKK